MAVKRNKRNPAVAAPKRSHANLQLPAELRLRIWRLALVAGKPIKFQHLKKGHGKVYVVRYGSQLSAQLLRCSKQIFQEARPILYQENNVTFDNVKDLAGIKRASIISQDKHLFSSISTDMTGNMTFVRVKNLEGIVGLKKLTVDLTTGGMKEVGWDPQGVHDVYKKFRAEIMPKLIQGLPEIDFRTVVQGHTICSNGKVSKHSIKGQERHANGVKLHHGRVEMTWSVPNTQTAITKFAVPTVVDVQEDARGCNCQEKMLNADGITVSKGSTV